MKSKSDKTSDSISSKSRRDFLRKSTYAAYATPAITLLLINSKAALASHAGTGGTPGSGHGGGGG